MDFTIIGFARGEDHSSSFQAINPVTGEASMQSYAHATLSELETACSLAKKASTILANMPGVRKADFLECVADRIDARVEDLVKVMTFESGLPEARVRAEAGRTCGQLRMFAGMVRKGDWVQARIDQAQPDRKPLPKPDLRSMLRPIGPVAVFCASNFPLAYSVAGGDSASAWAAGCPVIVKAHHAHPGTALVVAEAVVEAVKSCGFPEGTFSMLYGDGRKLGKELVMHPFIKAVGFTGSRAGGRALFDLASSRVEPIAVFAEMSSVNPVFVLPGLMEDKLTGFVSGLAGSATLGNGQFCTNPGIVFHPDGQLWDRLLS
ncbi:MAG: aldehyde dehydrogenase family protein [Opitutae bacterium]